MCSISNDAVAKMGCHQFTVLRGLRIIEHPVFTSRDGVFGACVNDGLQKVVKLGDVLLSFQQEFLSLLLHSQSNGCRNLFLS